MNSAAGIILAAGTITLANELLDAPYTQGATSVAQYINWRVIPATGAAALIFTGLDHVNPAIAKGLAALALFTVLFTRLGNSYSPIEHIAVLMGYDTIPGVPGATGTAPLFPPSTQSKGSIKLSPTQ